MAVYLGTVTPSAHYLGSAAVSKLYLGSVQVWPVITTTFTAQNSIWTAIGFSGAGTTASPYSKANYSTNMAGAQATVVSSGTVRITGQLYSDYGIDFYKNGSITQSIADANGGNGGNYTLNVTISVSANDVIRIGSSSGDYYTIPSTALNIWWQ